MDRARRKLVSAIDGIRNMHTRTDDGDSDGTDEVGEEARASSDEDQGELEIEERICSEHTTLAKIIRHGFPRDARCMAYDPVQRLLAIGATHGEVRLLGQAGVDYCLEHPSEERVEFVQFLVNEGGLITSLQDDSIHLWNYRQKLPEIVHSLQMSKEHITTLHLPFQTKWLYVGTDRGNVYFVSLSTFQLSAYVIMWNKAVDIGCRTHPGPVRQLALSPTDTTRLLLLYDKGAVVAWNLQTREAERFAIDHSPAKCLAWHHDGRQFMCGHKDGSLTIWSVKKPKEVVEKKTPHSAQDTKACRPITHLWWGVNGEQEQMMCFAGGMPSDEGALPAITVLRGKSSSVTVLEMDHPVVEVLPLYALPYPYLSQLPYSMAVLLKEDLLLVDLQANGYPCFESPHPFDVSESPVTALKYYAECPVDLIAALTLIGRAQRQKQQQGAASRLSENEWPLTGGVGRECARGFEELLLTGCVNHGANHGPSQDHHGHSHANHGHSQARHGHSKASHDTPRPITNTPRYFWAKNIPISGTSYDFSHDDGSIKFWQASGEHLHLMYRLKTGRHFEKTHQNHPHSSHFHPPSHPPSHLPSNMSLDLSGPGPSTSTAPMTISHAVEQMEMCLDSRLLLVASAAGQITLFRFVKAESCQEIAVIVLPQLTASTPNCPSSSAGGQADPNGQEHAVPSKLKPPQRAGSSPSPSRELRRQAHMVSSSATVGTDAHASLSLSSHGDSHSTDTSVGSQAEQHLPVKVRGGAMRRPGGYQPELVCQIPWGGAGGQTPERVTALSLNSAYGVAAIGTAGGVALVDIVTASLIYAWSNHELYAGEAVKPTRGAAPSKTPSNSPRDPQHKEANLTETLHYSSSSTSAITPPVSSATQSPLFAQSASSGIVGKRNSTTNRLNADAARQPHGGGGGRAASPTSPRPTLSKAQSMAVPGPSSSVGDLTEECNGELNEASRSSSTASLEKSPLQQAPVQRGTQPDRPEQPECVTCFQLLQSYSQRGQADAPANYTLWLGMSTGWCLALNLHMPEAAERMISSVVVAPSGPPLRLHGQLLHMAFLDRELCLLRGASESYRDAQKEPASPSLAANATHATPSIATTFPNRQVTKASMAPKVAQLGARTKQLALLISESEIRVIALPTYRLLQARRLEIPLVRARTSHVRGYPCLIALNGMGWVQIYSLPSLRLLSQERLFPFSLDLDDPVVVKFDFAESGMAMFAASASEVQKLTVDAEIAQQVEECSGEVFVPCDMPEPPKASFLRGLGTSLFGGAGSNSAATTPREAVDLDALFSERPSVSGVSSTKSVARQIPSTLLHHPPPLTNMESASSKSISAGQAAQQALQNLNERQERLNAVVDATDQLKNNAMSLQSRSAKLVEKYEKKRWWNL